MADPMSVKMASALGVVPSSVDANSYFDEYHGHTILHLESILKHVPKGRGVIFLVGDSTLDNKYWLLGTQGCVSPAINGYERVLKPPSSVPDVCYQLNKQLLAAGLDDRLVAINCAIEESTLGVRNHGKLLPQDSFVRQQITEKDVLVVSCGGNDIALRPTALTVAAIATLLSLPKALIKCGPWAAPGLAHFVGMFRDKTRQFIESLIAEGRKPRVVVVCMLYYLDVKPGGSWADNVLRLLGYDKDPSKLQLCMRMLFEHATSQIRIDGVKVVPVPMYEALDGTDSADYEQRVEPSAQGGAKMAKLIVERLKAAYCEERPTDAESSASGGAAASHDAAGPQVVAMPTAVHKSS